MRLGGVVLWVIANLIMTLYFISRVIANSTPKCDTRLCSLKVFLEHHFGLPESEAFTRPQV
ncbi:hypothetical protein ABIE61_003418 [Marinobacterium sp. MBR-111]